MPLRFPALLALVLAAPAAAQSAPDRLSDALSCTPFDWVDTDEAPRAAMIVPVVLDGVAYRLQLDTGADYSMVYGDIASARGWPVIGGFPHLVPSAEVGGLALGPIHVNQNARMTPDDEAQGTLGLDLLFGRTTVIDYPARRLCVMERGAAPEALWTTTAWSPATVRDGKLFVPVTLDGEPVEALAFDTGASASGLFVDYAPWRDLTGRADAADADTRWTGSAWGRSVTVVGAPVRGRLQVGPLVVPDGTPVHTEPDDPEDFASWAFPIGGLIGNAGLWDRVVVLDLGLVPRFGVVR